MHLLALVIITIIIYIQSKPCVSLTCAEVTEAGSGARFNDGDLQTLMTMTAAQLQPCIVLLGKDMLQPIQSETLWKVIVKVYGSASEIPETELKLLGWITSGIPPNDFRNLSLTDVDTIAAFGQYRNLSRNQLAALYETVTNVWSNKDEEDLSSYDLMTLKQMVCAFNATLISNIHPDAYRDAASELSTLQDCPKDVMAALAKLAVDEDAFGNPSKWTSQKVSSVGCVMSGLPNIHVIPVEAMRGLTSNMMKCIPSTTLQSMTKEQLSVVNPDGVIRAEAYQSSQKTSQEGTANNDGKNVSNTDKNSVKNQANASFISMNTIINICVIIIYINM